MILRVAIRGYKTFRETGPVALRPLTVIVGANATGKSNLVDLLGLLSSLARAESLEEAFTGHRGYPHEAFHNGPGFGEEGMQGLKSAEALAFRIEADLRLSRWVVDQVNRELEEREKLEGQKVPYTRVVCRDLRYILEVRLPKLGAPLVVSDESLHALKADGTPDQGRSPFLLRDEKAGRYVARLERQGHPRYFEPVRHRTILSETGDPVYHPHLVAAKREMASWRVFYVEPARIRREVGLLGAKDPGRSGENLAPFYYQLQRTNPAQFRELERNLTRLVPSVRGIESREGSQGLLELWVREETGGAFPLRLVSEGTLRLLCILAISATPEPPSVVVYEEPENGVHPRRLEELLGVFRALARGREVQVLLTTHSATLCDLLREEDEGLLVCRRGEGGVTTLEEAPAQPLLRQAVVAEAMSPEPSSGEKLLTGEYG